MSDANNAVEPSAAATPVQFDSWDEKGNPIVSKKETATSSAETPKAQESEPASTPEKKAPPEPEGKSAAESGAAPKQEKKGKQTAEERIAELVADRNRLEERLRKLETAPQPTSETKTEKQATPQTYAEWRKTFKPKEWLDGWTKEHPEGAYEDAIADLADYQSDIRLAYQRHEESVTRANQQTSEMLKQTIAKYPDAEPKVRQAAAEITGKAPQFVQAFVNESEVMTELLYTLSDSNTLNTLLDTAKTAPGKALRVLRDMETDIQKAVADAAKPAEPEKKVSPDPEKPRAPKPPSEVGGRGTASEDALVTAARSGDFRSFEAEQNRRLRASKA